MRVIWISLLCLVTASLGMSFIFKPKPKHYADIAREIRGKTGKKISQKYHMDCIGVGGGMMDSEEI